MMRSVVGFCVACSFLAGGAPAAAFSANTIEDRVTEYVMTRVAEPRRTQVRLRSAPVAAEALIRGEAWSGEAIGIWMRAPSHGGGPRRYRRHTVLLDDGLPIAFQQDDEVSGFQVIREDDAGFIQLARRAR